MATRQVTGTLHYSDGSTVWAGAPVLIAPQFPGSYDVIGITNANGIFSIDVPLPNSGNGSYTILFPNDVALQFTMGESLSPLNITPLVSSIESVAPLPDVQTLTDGATVSWNVALGAFGILTLGGSRSLANPTHLVAGASYALKVIQGGSGSYTITWGSAFKWAGGSAPTLSTAVGAIDILTFISDGTNVYGSALKAFA